MSKRILMVEDTEDNRQIVRDLLSSVGYELIEAVNGEEGVAMAKQHKPDLILMDIQLPVLDGYEATRRIREQPWGRSILIIALTGWGQEGDKLQSREAGCDGHLVKPVSLPDLEKLLAEVEASR